MKKRVVYVEWVDSHASTERVWSDEDDIAKDCKATICRSVGYLIASRNKHKAIAGHIDSFGNTSGSITIPNCAIVKLIEIPSKRFLPKK